MDKPRYTCSCDPALAKSLKEEYTYARQTVLELPPWSFAKKHRLQKGYEPTVCVDNCIVDAIDQLWDRGIETTGCCCGHNFERAWVNVHPDDYIAMFELGYEQRPVEVRDGHVFGVYTFYL
jgi:hypothetical protein